MDSSLGEALSPSLRVELGASPRLATLAGTHPLLGWFESLARWTQFSLIAGLIMVLGWVDDVTGFEISFSIFYLAPVALAAWCLGRTPGFVVALVCAAVWMWCEIHSGQKYRIPLIHVWNALVRAGFFAIVVWLLAALRLNYHAQVALTYLDGLTGLFNARAFYKAAENEVETMRQTGAPLSIAYMDLDNFKHVNDTLGHLAGDDLLRSVGWMMNQNLRQSDVPARLGGDEFALLFPGTNSTEAKDTMERMKQELSAQMRGRGWPVTFSMGIVTHSHPPESVEQMVHGVDELMYEVKRGGKNRITAVTA